MFTVTIPQMYSTLWIILTHKMNESFEFRNIGGSSFDPSCKFPYYHFALYSSSQNLLLMIFTIVPSKVAEINLNIIFFTTNMCSYNNICCVCVPYYYTINFQHYLIPMYVLSGFYSVTSQRPPDIVWCILSLFLICHRNIIRNSQTP